MFGSINLGIRFLLELALLAALGFWGFTIDAGWPARAAAGIGAPLVALVAWGMFIAPKGAFLLPEPGRVALEVVLFGAASLALARADHQSLAVVLAGAALANIAVMFALGQR